MKMSLFSGIILSGFLAATGHTAIASAIPEQETTPEGCTLSRITVFSPSMQRTIRVAVLLPPGYSKNPQQRYPVLYAFHGYGAPYETWVVMPRLRQALAKMPMIVVAMDGDKGSWYLNSEKLQKTESHPAGAKSLFTTFFLDELIPDLEHRFRMDPKKRMLTGFSMGGFGAFHYFLTRPEAFVSVSSLSGAFFSFMTPAPKASDLLLDVMGPYEGNKEAYHAIDLYERVKRAQAKGHKMVPFYLHCGTEDFLLDENRAFRDFLKSKAIPVQYLETPGGHNWDFWKDACAGVIEFHWKSIHVETDRGLRET